MGLAVGIDLGTTNSVISYYKRGKVETIALDGKNTFPSVISIRNGQIMTGYPAKTRVIMDPLNSVGSTKRDLGYDITYNIGSRIMTPVDVACEVLKAMKEKCEFTLGEQVTDAVITVPAYFTSIQREETKRAAEMAGFKVLRLMPEPTAAALSYGLNQNRNQTIMVYDLGGGTFDVSILKVVENNFEVIAVDGDSRLGGDDFDERICDDIYKKVAKDTGKSLKTLNDRAALSARQKIKEGAEKAKIELSDKESTEIVIPNLIDDYHLEYEINRVMFEYLIRDYLTRTTDKMKNVMDRLGMTADDIDRVILVGGSTKSQIVRETVKKKLRDPYNAPNVDEVVSNGAAIMAAMLSMPDDQMNNNMMLDLKVTEITTHSYGIDMLNEEDELYFAPIIKRGTKLPAKRGTIGLTAKPFQQQVVMNVFRGESIELYENEELGGLMLQITDPSIDSVPVGAIFEMDENMIIHFTSVELPLNDYTQEIVERALRRGRLDVERVEELIKKGILNCRKIDIDGSAAGERW